MFDLANRRSNSFGVSIISHSQRLEAPLRKEDFDSAPGNAIEGTSQCKRSRKSGERDERDEERPDGSEHPPSDRRRTTAMIST